MSARQRIDRRALLGLIAAGTLGGCVSGLTKPAPEKRQYVLSATRPGREPTPSNGLVLLMRRFTIDPAYQDRGIVTRSDGVSVSSDFYNEFFIDPAQLVSGQVMAWLQAAGLFSEIVGPTSALGATHVLEGHVVKLYGDLSGAPAAVLELQLLLLDVRAGGNRVLLHPDYDQREPASGKDPAALVEGWNKALSGCLATFEQSVRTVIA